ncbi:RNA polymerase subunit sigma-70, partial [Clostridium tetani]
YCGKEFSAYGNKNRKYCSHNCYIRDRFWRDEENGI